MDNTFEAIQAVNSNSPPVNEPVQYPPSSNANGVPSKLNSWWSNDIFRIVCFSLIVFVTLALTSTAFFADKISTDQWLGVISSLLFMMMPSPLQGKKQKKVVYLSNNPV